MPPTRWAARGRTWATTSPTPVPYRRQRPFEENLAEIGASHAVQRDPGKTVVLTVPVFPLIVDPVVAESSEVIVGKGFVPVARREAEIPSQPERAVIDGEERPAVILEMEPGIEPAVHGVGSGEDVERVGPAAGGQERHRQGSLDRRANVRAGRRNPCRVDDRYRS